MKNSPNDHLAKNLTIVIVLYKESFQLISKTLSTINSFKKIIIDNDNNIDLEKKIKSEFNIEKYILNKKNNGFSSGYNQGIRMSDTKYTLVLGPDCIITEKDILILIKRLIENIDCYIVSPTSFDENGKLSYAGGPLPDNSEKNIILDIEGDTCVDSTLGACMLFRTKEALENNLIFDENFFLYYSDDDLCRRVKKSKKHIIQVYDSKCIHQHGIIKVKNKYLKKFIREYNLLFDKFYYFYKINNHQNLINLYKKKIPLLIFKFFLRILTFNFLGATEIASKLFAYYKFKFKFLIK